MTKPPFELRILGPTELHGPVAETSDGPDALVRQPKRLAILAYLALATADGYRRRDQVMALFWPELDQANGRTYLRKSLHGIRESLGDNLFLTRGEDEVRINPAKVACDAVALLEHVRESRWSDALVLYRGELLEGLFPEGVAQEFQEWLSAQRKKIREAAAGAAWKCSELEELRGDRTAAAVMARRARELDPDNEEGVRRLMALLDRRGDRGSALRLYGDWQSRLLEEFGVEPAPETRKLARHIQAARKGESHDTPPVAVPAAPPALLSETAPDPLIPVVRLTPERATTERTWARLIIGALALVVVTIAATSAYFNGRWWVSVTQSPSVAVFPLNAIGGTEARALADAIAEEIATRLALDTAVVVRSAVRSAATAGGPPTFATDGAVQRGDGKVRITLRLLRTADGVAVWTGSFDEPDGEPLAIAQRIASATVNGMRTHITTSAR